MAMILNHVDAYQDSAGDGENIHHHVQCSVRR